MGRVRGACGLHRYLDRNQIDLLELLRFRRARMRRADQMDKRCVRGDFPGVGIHAQWFADHWLRAGWQLVLGSLANQCPNDVPTRVEDRNET